MTRALANLDRRALAGLLGWVVALAFLLPAGAAAHAFNPLLLELREEDTGLVDVLWKVPAGSEGGELVVPADVAALRPELPAACRLVGAPAARPARGGITTTWQLDCGSAGLDGAVIAIAGLTGSPRDVLVRLVRPDGREQTALVDGSRASLRVDDLGAAEPQVENVRDTLGLYVLLGAQHIVLGADHLLFVLGLVLLVAGRRGLVWTVTAFTIAHSATLVLTTLSLVHLPVAPVEAAIALSIVLLAVELTRPQAAPPTWARRAPWLVAGVFGLLHGFGFASALGDIGLPSGSVPLALFGFNVGVELGQLAFVAVVLTVLAGLRGPARSPGARRLATLATAYVLGGVAMAWTFERVARFTEILK